jgi:hypothetical protein
VAHRRLKVGLLKAISQQIHLLASQLIRLLQVMAQSLQLAVNQVSGILEKQPILLDRLFFY